METYRMPLHEISVLEFFAEDDVKPPKRQRRIAARLEL